MRFAGLLLALLPAATIRENGRAHGRAPVHLLTNVIELQLGIP